jgi:dienelactone hydrolase
MALMYAATHRFVSDWQKHMTGTVRLATIVAVGLCAGLRLTAVQPEIDVARGAEFATGANLIARNVKADAAMFVPDAARRVRAVIVLVESWPGAERGAYDLTTGRRLPEERPITSDLAVGRFRDDAWRRLSQSCECALLHLRLGTIRPEADVEIVSNGVRIRSGVSNRVVRTASEGGADALLVILQRLGDESSHQELKDAPLLLWGWSAAASFGTTFAELYPQRSVAFIRYHTHLRGLSPDLNLLKTIPALLIAGGNDALAGTADAEALWIRARSAGAPWTFAIEPGATHGGEETFVSSHALMLPWIAAVVRQRVEPADTRLRAITEERAWLGNNRSAEVVPFAAFSGPRERTSWLPDEATARGWQTVLGR